MASLLLVDESAAHAELFSAAIATRLGYAVHTCSEPRQVLSVLKRVGPMDLALVHLTTAADPPALLEAAIVIHRYSRSTRLALIATGNDTFAGVLRDAWELLPIATAIASQTTLDHQLQMISRVVQRGEATPDPALRHLLPTKRNPYRTPDSFARLVQHAGHAKLWRALASLHDLNYETLSYATGLKRNTLKNYRAQLVDELGHHGLTHPSLTELGDFARRCRPFLQPFIELALHEQSA